MIPYQMSYLTMGTVSTPRDEREIAILDDGKKILIDIADMSRQSFAESLEKILDRNITEESRNNIIEALEYHKTSSSEDKVSERERKES